MNIEDKVKTGQFIFDEAGTQVTFLDTRFYSMDGVNFIPSVTSVLSCFPKSEEFLRWLKENGSQADEIRDDAGVHGSIVHNLIDRYLKDEVVSLMDSSGVIKYTSKQWNQFEKFISFYERFKPTIIHNEFNLISPTLGIAGTIDLVVELEGKIYILDLKTSNNIQKTHFLQLAAYKKLYEEQFPEVPISGIGVFWLNSKTRTEGKGKGVYQGSGYQIVFPDRDLDHYWNLFKATKVLYDEEYANAKPKNVTYTIIHKK